MECGWSRRKLRRSFGSGVALMNPPVDTSSFQLAGEPDPEEDEKLAQREREAREYIARFTGASPIKETLLAFGVSDILALFLVRFEEPIRWDGEEDAEIWVVVGDLPPAHLVTDDCINPPDALETYCVFMEDWADRVLKGEDLEGAYLVTAEPTQEHAEMLKSRIEFIRDEIIPVVQAQAREKAALQ